MSRLPALRRDELASDRRAVYDAICSARGTESLDERGGLAGPFNAFVQAPPELGQLLLQAGNALNFRTGLSLRLTELAVITVGARWRSEFEWWAHARRARDAGISDVIVEDIGAGRVPVLDDASELAVYRFAHQLVHEGAVADETYQAAAALLDPSELVGLVSICGYYTLISFTLNAFTVRLPPGATPRWGA